MQTPHNGGNLLRNSYGFQGQEPPQMRSPPSKGFPMPAPIYLHPHPDPIPNSIRQMENKIEGVESMVKRKLTQTEQSFTQPPKYDLNESRFRSPQVEEPISEYQLRGSCQNILRKFDYSNLRNTTHFNPMAKQTAHNELRRSPQEEAAFRSPQVNRTLIPEAANTFLRPNEKKLLENKHSFVVNSANRTPPKYGEKPPEVLTSNNPSRTPTKYKSIFENSTKTSATSRRSPQAEDKKVFKSLNEIMANKNKEKPVVEAVRPPLKTSRMINGFEFGNVLGKGKFGEVFLARHHETGFIAAIKKIERGKVVEFKMMEQFAKEIRLHSCLDHPNIVKFFGVFQEKEEIYLVMEFMNGGTLFDYLNEVTALTLREAAEYLRDIIEALTYMHDKSIAHRDIKPENIVVSSEGVAKLCDFGWSAVVETSRKTYCGTFDYAPPEILQRKHYDTSVDIWCIGVLTFQLLTGRVPFEGEKRNVVMEKIVNVDKIKIDYPPDMPPQAREFIECLVQKDPNLRPKSHDLLKFRFFAMHLPKAKLKKIP